MSFQYDLKCSRASLRLKEMGQSLFDMAQRFEDRPTEGKDLLDAVGRFLTCLKAGQEVVNIRVPDPRPGGTAGNYLGVDELREWVKEVREGD